jgi:hypothetical protein
MSFKFWVILFSLFILSSHSVAKHILWLLLATACYLGCSFSKELNTVFNRDTIKEMNGRMNKWIRSKVQRDENTLPNHKRVKSQASDFLMLHQKVQGKQQI